MIRIAIIMGSTRPGRKAEAVGKWIYEIARLDQVIAWGAALKTIRK